MNTFAPFLVVIVLAAFLFGLVFSEKPVEERVLRLLPAEGNFSFLIKVPGVGEEGEGVITEIGVTVEPDGEGRVLTDIEDMLFFTDTQNSIRTARDVAQDVTGIDLSRHDIVYTIRANASVIEGPSAGAAIAVATIAALEGLELNPEVMITGTIRKDGSIGRVGGLLEKAQVAENHGAKLFLVPESGVPLGGFEYKRDVKCGAEWGFEVCETSYVSADSGCGLGIEVKEVSNVEEALEYFLLEEE
ncbi:MAG: hypothetical protein ISS93_03375 [Candidatus Aenigmarchaeota archaeon]|nr:hypothetical protein [Candidatus Aenigmarchaeota archaeon]